MQAVTKILNTLLPVLYALALLDYLIYFFRQRAIITQTAGVTLRIAVAVHLTELITRSVAYNHFPLVNVFEAVSAIAFAMALVYMMIELFTTDRSMGLFILCIVFLLQFVSSAYIANEKNIPVILSGTPFIFHTLFAVIAYSSFAISAMYGFFYLMLYHEIKYSRFGILFKRLTSLEMLGRLNFWAAVVGFFSLTVAIAFGFLLGTDAATNFSAADPKVIAVFCTWGIYGGCIAVRKFYRYEGNWFMHFSIIGFLIGIFSVVISFLLTSFHRFG